MAARVTLTHFVWVQILVPQPKAFKMDYICFERFFMFSEFLKVRFNKNLLTGVTVKISPFYFK